MPANTFYIVIKKKTQKEVNHENFSKNYVT